MRQLYLFCVSLLCTAVVTAQEILVNDDTHVLLTNLPHVYINTFGGGMPTSKTTQLWASMYYVDEAGLVTYYDSLQIRCRGNSTYSNASGKYAYRIKFAAKQKLLGKGYAKAKKWTMLANQFDKTLMRNALTSLMGEQAGLKFNPAAKFVDLTINGSYRGNYQISDQIDVRPHRVNIAEQDEVMTTASDITGGYLMEVDGFADFRSYSYYDYDAELGTWVEKHADGFYTSNRRVPVRIHYPDEDDISDSQYNYIYNYVQEFENRLYSSNYKSATQGYRPLVDSLSLANWYICTEMSGNIDGFFSTYFYKEQADPHLYWGPLWDYDIAYNNDNRTDRNGTSDTSRQMMSDYGYGTSNGCRYWMQQLWSDPWFARLINRRYQQLIDDGIEEYLYQKIDSLEELLTESQQRNYRVWGISTRYCRERVLYSTYDAGVQAIRRYIQTHLPYLKTAFAKYDHGEPDPEPTPEPVTPSFVPQANYFYGFANVGSETLLDADATTDMVQAWRRTDGRENQQWSITLLDNGYYHIVNRVSGLALNDPTEGEVGETVNVGTQLNVVRTDVTSARQQWQINSIGNDQYNLINAYTKHTANLSGGGRANGTSVLSYTTDEKNQSSNNRKWVIQYLDSIGSNPDGIAPLDGADGSLSRYDYALAYNPYTHRLHFGCDDPAVMGFPVRVYSADGRRVLTFTARDGADLTPMPRGIYIVAWTFEGCRQSVKVSRE